MRQRFLLLSGCAVVLLVLVTLTWVLQDRQDRRVDQPMKEFLQSWYDAVANQTEEPVRVVFVGDSITEGVLLEPPVREHRVTDVLQQLLREEAGTTGGAGYLPAYYADPTTQDETVPAGTPSRQESFGPWGLGGRALVMPGGATLAYPAQEATSVRVWYGRSAFVGGHGKVFVDGVDVTANGTLRDGTRSGTTIPVAGEENGSGLWWHSDQLVPGPHVVEVRSVAPGAVFVHTGLEFFDGDEDSGIHVYDGAHSGATTEHFAQEDTGVGHWADVEAIEPHLVVVNLGTNPDAEHLENLHILVERALRAAPRAQVLLVDGYRAGTWSKDDWERVRSEKHEVAAAHPDRVAVFDLARRWPEVAEEGVDDQGLMLEGEPTPLHPSVEGHRRMAEIYADLLAPRD